MPILHVSLLLHKTRHTLLEFWWICIVMRASLHVLATHKCGESSQNHNICGFRKIHCLRLFCCISLRKLRNWHSSSRAGLFKSCFCEQKASLKISLAYAKFWAHYQWLYEIGSVSSSTGFLLLDTNVNCQANENTQLCGFKNGIITLPNAI